ncbi:aldo/keto reductase [Rhizobium sp. L1K21]|uniref:aldo/keto reductase n=1 Tax=Rhizobium sp. L1K21 TaxID=2954933 RepID=UPI00209318AA|nr:aldo/keto reductase [Rhizobium sp. L1K21]MCO6188101.1 aldo/keto reductase [Rhizobium sp. L1K21]
MTEQAFLEFHDGNRIPQLGLGVFKTGDDIAAPTIRKAIETGYRHIDTAAMYDNEKGVGEGVRTCGLPREEIFVTTKLWNDNQGRDKTLKAFDESFKRLGLDYIDLYLIHWPAPNRGLYVETWKTLIELKAEGRVRSIGVSNFCPEHLEKIIDETGVKPVINQVELHPLFQQKKLRETHAKHGILTECWSPLGRGELLDNPAIMGVAKKHDRTAAQVIIRWHLQNGLVVIPKSSNPERIEENFNVFDFILDDSDMRAIGGLDSALGRIGPDPMTATF